MSIWSRRFAEDVARTFGFFDLSEEKQALEKVGGVTVAECLEAMTETFRYLPLEQVNWTTDLAHFLSDREKGARYPGWIGAKLREVHEYMLFLRGRHGYEQPADEKDYWTDEDRQDLRRAAWRRLEEEGPWPEDDYPLEEQGNAQTG